MSIGEGIKEQSPPPENNTKTHLDKANSLLDEMSREEKSGFKAEIKKSEKSDQYDEDFEQIEEDLPQDDLEGSGNLGGGKIGESHGITVS